MIDTIVLIPEAIDRLRILFVKENEIIENRELDIAADQYSSALNDIREEKKLNIQSLKRLVVAFGGPSSTANRIATTVINAIHFVFSVPVYSFVFDGDLENITTYLANADLGEPYIKSKYNLPPNIT